jgi:hypothetical protein
MVAMIRTLVFCPSWHVVSLVVLSPIATPDPDLELIP